MTTKISDFEGNVHYIDSGKLPSTKYLSDIIDKLIKEDSRVIIVDAEIIYVKDIPSEDYEEYIFVGTTYTAHNTKITRFFTREVDKK